MIEIAPATLEKWQRCVDLMAMVVGVPAGLIMRLDGDDIEVFVSSRSAGNPYEPGSREHFQNSGLYCETVVNRGDRLLVPDARVDPDWDSNPDIKLGMISYLGFPILLPTGAPFGTICVLDNRPNSYSETYSSLVAEFRDIIQAQLALLDANAELVRLNGEILGQKAEIADLNRQKDRFFSIIAHDLKNLFTPLLGRSEMLARLSERLDPTQVAEWSHEIHQAGCNVFGLLENLLEWARLQIDNTVIEPEKMDIRALIEQSVTLFSLVAETKNITVDMGRVESTMIDADHQVFGVVIRNLINNAIKFTESGGHVHVATRNVGRRCEIRVSDTGVGIPPETVKLLFRAEDIVSTPGTGGEGGTGLGLLLCHELLKKSGGTLIVESETGVGSTFRFSLPLVG